MARRRRLTGAICLKLRPKTREQFEQVADAKDLTLSELARAYIEEALAREGAEGC
jgi:hypothetical protein